MKTAELVIEERHWCTKEEIRHVLKNSAGVTWKAELVDESMLKCNPNPADNELNCHSYVYCEDNVMQKYNFCVFHVFVLIC